MRLLFVFYNWHVHSDMQGDMLTKEHYELMISLINEMYSKAMPIIVKIN